MGAMQQMMLGTSSGATGPTDPYFAFVKSLLHLDGTNGSTTISDVKGKTWTCGGLAALSTTGPKFGSAAVLCQRANNDFIYTPTSADFDIASTAAGFEFWYKPTTVPTGGTFHWLLAKGGAGAAGIHMFLFSGSIYVRNNATELVTPVAHGMSAGNWYHIRFGKDSSNNNYLGIDGALLSTGSGNTTNNSADLIIGGVSGAGHFSDGRFDDFRWDTGVNRYGTSTYTVPTAAHPNS